MYHPHITQTVHAQNNDDTQALEHKCCCLFSFDFIVRQRSKCFFFFLFSNKFVFFLSSLLLWWIAHECAACMLHLLSKYLATVQIVVVCVGAMNKFETNKNFSDENVSHFQITFVTFV